jgi:hypothetical protein
MPVNRMPGITTEGMNTFQEMVKPKKHGLDIGHQPQGPVQPADVPVGLGASGDLIGV